MKECKEFFCSQEKKVWVHKKRKGNRLAFFRIHLGFKDDFSKKKKNFWISNTYKNIERKKYPLKIALTYPLYSFVTITADSSLSFDLNIMRSFRVLRPLKLVSKVQSKSIKVGGIFFSLDDRWSKTKKLQCCSFSLLLVPIM